MSDISFGVKVTQSETKFEPGQKVYIRKGPLYDSGESPKATRAISGNYYIVNKYAINGRVRIAVSESACANNDIWGWTNVRDCVVVEEDE